MHDDKENRRALIKRDAKQLANIDLALVIADKLFKGFADEKKFAMIANYQWFLSDGLKELFDEESPICDFSGRKMELHFLSHSLDKPKYEPLAAKRKNLSYEAYLKVHVQLINKELGEIKEQDVYLGTIPLMTDKGTFIINGIERVVDSQIVLSSGVFYSRNPAYPQYFNAKVIPKRGAWLEIETDRKGVITCKIDRKGKIPIAQLLRIFGYEKDTEIHDLFKGVNIDMNKDYIQNTLEKDTARTVEDAYQSIYRKIRPGDLATPENAKQLIESLFFDFKRYDMGVTARHKLNKRFGRLLPDTMRYRVFQVEDFVNILKRLVELNSGEGEPDDIDDLSDRHIQTVGELVQDKFRMGLRHIDRIAKYRMSVMDLETVTPYQLISDRITNILLNEIFYKFKYKDKIRNILFSNGEEYSLFLGYITKDDLPLFLYKLEEDIPELKDNVGLLNEIFTYLFNLGVEIVNSDYETILSKDIMKKYPKVLLGLIIKGLAQRFITHQELLEAMPTIENNVILLDEIYTLFLDLGIEVMDVKNDIIWPQNNQ